MKKSVLLAALKLSVLLLLVSTLVYLNAENVKPEADVEYIELRHGGKVPLIEDPCIHDTTAKQEAEALVTKYQTKKWNLSSIVAEAKIEIAEINAKKLDHVEHLATIIERSSYLWACKNGYKIRNTRSLGQYYFKKDDKTNMVISVGVKAEGYLPFQGLRKGSASLALDERGQAMETHYLHVVISDANPKPNEKFSKELDGEAQTIINQIVEYSYVWGLEYYSTIVEKAK